MLEQVKHYYGNVLKTTADLQTNACCTAESLPAPLSAVLQQLAPEVVERYYGCGLVVPDALHGLRVLDLGCGTGSTAIVHAPYVKHIHATDISPNMIEIAKRKAAAEGTSNITFDVASVEDLEVTEGSLDAVLGLSILHLLEDKAAAIAGAFALLKPGGVFVTTTPCIADSMRWFRYLVPVGRLLGLFPLVKVFGSDDLRRSLVEAGFELDYEWQPDDGRTLFIVARKPEQAAPAALRDAD